MVIVFVVVVVVSWSLSFSLLVVLVVLVLVVVVVVSCSSSFSLLGRRCRHRDCCRACHFCRQVVDLEVHVAMCLDLFEVKDLDKIVAS